MLANNLKLLVTYITPKSIQQSQTVSARTFYQHHIMKLALTLLSNHI